MLSEQNTSNCKRKKEGFPLLIALKGPHREALIDECHTNGEKRDFRPVSSRLERDRNEWYSPHTGTGCNHIGNLTWQRMRKRWYFFLIILLSTRFTYVHTFDRINKIRVLFYFFSRFFLLFCFFFFFFFFRLLACLNRLISQVAHKINNPLIKSYAPFFSFCFCFLNFIRQKVIIIFFRLLLVVFEFYIWGRTMRRIFVFSLSK